MSEGATLLLPRVSRVSPASLWRRCAPLFPVLNMPAEVDPFRAIQEETSACMAELRNDLVKWRKLPSKSPKVEPGRQKMMSSLSELKQDLQDMQDTIDIAIKDPVKFQLTPSELMSRQEFVRDLQAQANDATEELEFGCHQSPCSSSTKRIDRQQLLAGSSSSGSSSAAGHDLRSSSASGGLPSNGGGACSSSSNPGASAAWAENESECRGAKQQQEQIMERQEVELGMIDKSVQRLGQMGKIIGDELRQQGKDLDSFTEEVDDVSSKMAHATAVMKKMLKKKDRGKLCAILVLTIVFIFLVYAVLAW